MFIFFLEEVLLIAVLQSFSEARVSFLLSLRQTLLISFTGMRIFNWMSYKLTRNEDHDIKLKGWRRERGDWFVWFVYSSWFYWAGYVGFGTLTWLCKNSWWLCVCGTWDEWWIRLLVWWWDVFQLLIVTKMSSKTIGNVELVWGCINSQIF